MPYKNREDYNRYKREYWKKQQNQQAYQQWENNRLNKTILHLLTQQQNPYTHSNFWADFANGFLTPPYTRNVRDVG